VESSPFHSACHDISSDRTIGLIMAVLESGHSVELPATGYSMFPTLKPGDSVVVRPLAKEELPMLGNVVVCLVDGARVQGCNGVTIQTDNKSLVMHRLIEITEGNDGESLFITRGDSVKEPDKPWAQQQLLGLAKSYKRGKKDHSIKTFTPGAWRYLYNHRLLWMYNKIMRLTRGLMDDS